MSWRKYTVDVRLRGSVGKRATAIMRMSIYANSHEEAITKAKERLLDAPRYEVRVAHP